ncbi:MAG: hypothetical protein ACR2F8_02995 [Caulobacteraceae bacterium]
MKLAILAAAFVACAAIAGCANFSTAPLVPASDQVAVAQGEGALETTYNIGAQAYLAALPHLSAATKAKTKPEMIRAYQALTAARAAEALGDAATAAAQAQALGDLIAEVKADLTNPPS